MKRVPYRKLPGISIIRRARNSLCLVRMTQVVRSRWTTSREQDAEGKEVLMFALRSPTWIDWFIAMSHVVSSFGFRPVIVASRNELARHYLSPVVSKRLIPENARVVYIEDVCVGETSVETYALSDRELTDGVAYDKHLEGSDVRRARADFQEDLNALSTASAVISEITNRLLEGGKVRVVLCCSGLIGHSIAVRKVCNLKRVTSVFFEGWAWRKGHMIFNFNKPALDYNIKGWMEYYGWDDKKEEFVQAYIRFQNGESVDAHWAKSFHNVQRAPVAPLASKELSDFIGTYGKVWLALPNVIGDSSTIGRETIFDGMKEWLDWLIDYFKGKPDRGLVIRAHPAEQWVKEKVATQLGAYAKMRANGVPNVLVINSNETINTFSLLPYVCCGLVWMSSVGVDLVVRGVPVICAAKPKYSGLGVALEPETLEEYRELLSRDAEKLPYLSKDAALNGRMYLHTVFKGFSIKSHGDNFRASGWLQWDQERMDGLERIARISLGLEESPDGHRW